MLSEPIAVTLMVIGALEALGVLKDVRHVNPPIVATFEPSLERHTRYRQGMKRQQELYDRLVRQENEGSGDSGVAARQ